jgi:hypothetical protein
LKLLAPQHIDKRKWDEMVAFDAQLDFFSLSWVWDILHPNWEMLCDNEGKFLGPVPFGNKFGLHFRLQPFFIRSLSFVSTSVDSFPELLQFLSSSTRFIELNFTATTHGGFTGIGQFQQLSLIPSLEELKNGYSSNAKRLLKKTPDTFHFETLDSPKDFVSFFKEQKGEELTGFTDLVWKRLSDFLHETQKQGLLSLYVVKDDSKMIAAGAFISFKETCYFFKGTATSEGKKTGAMYFLLDQVINSVQPTHHTLDFVGSNNEAIAQFYRKFGAENKTYSILKQNNLPSMLKWLKS